MEKGTGLAGRYSKLQPARFENYEWTKTEIITETKVMIGLTDREKSGVILIKGARKSETGVTRVRQTSYRQGP